MKAKNVSIDWDGARDHRMGRWAVREVYSNVCKIADCRRNLAEYREQNPNLFALALNEYKAAGYTDRWGTGHTDWHGKLMLCDDDRRRVEAILSRMGDITDARDIVREKLAALAHDNSPPKLVAQLALPAYGLISNISRAKARVTRILGPDFKDCRVDAGLGSTTLYSAFPYPARGRREADIVLEFGQPKVKGLVREGSSEGLTPIIWNVTLPPYWRERVLSKMPAAGYDHQGRLSMILDATYRTEPLRNRESREVVYMRHTRPMHDAEARTGVVYMADGLMAVGETDRAARNAHRTNLVARYERMMLGE